MGGGNGVGLAVYSLSITNEHTFLNKRYKILTDRETVQLIRLLVK